MEANKGTDTKGAMTPKLRFKGFDGDWQIARLGEICRNFKSGEGITSKDIFETGEFPVYGGNGLRGYTDSYTHDGFYVLIGRQGALCGNINRVYGKVFISEHAIAVDADDTADTNWLAHKLEYLKLNRLSESSAQPGLAVNKLLRLKLTFPTLPEQQKIASFLSSVDQKIQQLTRKKELLEKYKKGVMQQLFSGKLRFKDDTSTSLSAGNGKAFPDWEEKRLGDVCEIKGRIGYRGYTVQDIVKEGEGAITLSPSNIISGNLSFDESTYISWAKYEESPEIIIELNDILLVKTGSTVGKSAFVKTLPVPATINPQLVVLKKVSKIIEPRFFAYLIFHSTVQKQIVAAVGSGAVPNMSQESISSFSLNCPCRSEQQKIANCLSAIDTKIEFVSKQINQTQNYKKGLLQQMFV